VIRAADMAAMLARQVEAVAVMLLPGGKRQGHEWCAGSIGGEAGSSLKVHMTGHKAGVWSDFATGQSGDLIDLWAAARGLDMRQTLAEVRDYLGVREQRIENPRRVFSKPSREGVQALLPQHAQWLSEVRKITPATAARFKLASRKGALMFPSLRDGELIAAKYRKIPAKEFFVDADCEPVLFGWQALTGSERVIALVEGELDALAAAEYGIPALSVPFGGGKGAKQGQWIESEFDRLAMFDTLFVCMDSDEPGQEAAAEIVNRLGRERCRVATLPRKDFNACLIDGVAKDEVLAALAASKTMDPEQLRQASEFGEALVSEFAVKVGAEAGVRLPWDKCESTVVLRPEEVSVWLGVNGHGKSQGMGQITLGAMAQGYRCCVASMEFKPVKWLKRMVRQAAALEHPTPAYVRHIAHWFHDKLWVFEATGTAKADEILEVFAYAARRYGVQFFLIDNLAKCGLAEDDYNGQKAFIDRLGDFAKDYSVHVALVHHMRKPKDENAPGSKMDAKGTGAITDMVDTVAVWWRNKPKEQAIKAAQLKGVEPDPEFASKPDGLLIFGKQRNGEEEPTYALWFDQPSMQFLGKPDHRPHQFVGFSSLAGRGDA